MIGHLFIDNHHYQFCIRFGRRPNLAGHYIVGGLLCMATAVVPLGRFAYEWPIVVLAMTGKYVSQVCWGIVYTVARHAH